MLDGTKGLDIPDVLGTFGGLDIPFIFRNFSVTCRKQSGRSC